MEEPGATVLDAARAAFHLYAFLEERFNLMRLELYDDPAAPLRSGQLTALYPEAVLRARPDLLRDEPDRPPAELEDVREAAVDMAIDLSRGVSPNEKVYQRKLKNTRDVVAAVVVDSSSSTGQEVPGQKQRRIIDVEKAALALAAAAMSRLGDTFAYTPTSASAATGSSSTW